MSEISHSRPCYPGTGLLGTSAAVRPARPRSVVPAAPSRNGMAAGWYGGPTSAVAGARFMTDIPVVKPSHVSAPERCP